MRRKRPILPLAFSVKALADAIELPRRVVYEALETGALASVRIGTHRRIIVTEAIRWLATKPWRNQ